MVTLLHDFRKQPRELFDGFEPAMLTFHPASLDLGDYEPVDLVASCSAHPEQTLTPEIQRELQLVAPPRIQVFDKSSSRYMSVLGDYAITRSSSHADYLVILFSFFEVSPMRYHAYVHAVLRVDQSAQIESGPT